MAVIDDPFIAVRVAIGNIVITWAHAENMLAGAISIIDEHQGPLVGFPEIPVALKKRIAFLRRAASSVLTNQSLADEARLLAERFGALKEGRHELVHGAGWQITEGVFESLRILVEKREVRSQQRFFKIADAVAFNVEVISLADQTCAFLSRIVAIYD